MSVLTNDKRPYKNKSPAKRFRSIKRLVSFQYKLLFAANTSPTISIGHQEHISILPNNPLLTISVQSSTSTQPKPQNLSICPSSNISIPGRKIYHPAIIKASQSMFEKHPDLLTKEEAEKFNHYRKYKIDQGDPIEESIIYSPCGGMKRCLQCDQPT